MRNKTLAGLCVGLLGGVAGFGLTAYLSDAAKTADAAHHRATAIAVITPTEGNEVSGTVTFKETDGGVEIEAHLHGLPEGKHGFHIHEFGDISAPDGTSAGGHFNPEGHDHAGPDSGKRHIGDLGNIEGSADGHGMYKRVDKVIKLEGENAIVGYAVVIHADEDDLSSQPTGAAGARIGVGVIGVGKRE